MERDFLSDDEQVFEDEEPTDSFPGLEDFGDFGLPVESLLERFGLESVEETTDDFVLPLLEVVEETEEELGLTEETSEQPAPAAPGELLPPVPGSGDLLPDPFADREEAQPATDERAWYIIHCYSGYEHKVKHNLEQRIESMGMQDFIFQVVVPTVEEIEIRDGKRRTVERCLYPGYIMVQMLLSDDSWYVVRNTPGVTGFVGMGNAPVPLRMEQVQNILRRMEAAAPQVRATFKPGQKVRIIEGPFADFIGVVDEIDEERTKVRVLVSFFGRETPVELDFLQVEKV